MTTGETVVSFDVLIEVCEKGRARAITGRVSSSLVTTASCESDRLLRCLGEITTSVEVESRHGLPEGSNESKLQFRIE